MISTTQDVLRRNNVKAFGRGTQPMLFAHGFGCDQNMSCQLNPFRGGSSCISPGRASPEASTKLTAHRIKSTTSAVRLKRRACEMISSAASEACASSAGSPLS